MIRMDLEYPDFEKFKRYIRADCNINYLDAAKFSQIISTYSARKETCTRNISDALDTMLGYTLMSPTRDSKREGIISAGVPANIFKDKKKTSGFSMDAERMQKALEFIEMSPSLTDRSITAYNYIKWTAEESVLSTTLSRATGAVKDKLIVPSEDMYGWDGNKLLEAYNIYVQQRTGRFYPRNLSITSLPLAIRQCFVAPQGTFLAGFDFRQIDFEVMYNIFLRGYYPEDDAIYDAELEDKYKAMYKIICNKTGMAYNEEYYIDNRGDIKTAVLSAGYGGQMNTLFNTFKDSVFCKALRDYFDRHTGYIAVVEKIVVMSELRISFQVKDFFGYKLDVPVTEVRQFEGEVPLTEEQIIKFAISYIVQSTSNSIYTKWVNYIMDEFIALGLEEEVWVPLSVFDEAVFCLSGEALTHFYIFRNACRIRIADWGPIRLKPEIYIHYKETLFSYPEEAESLKLLSDEIERNCDANKDRILKDLPKGKPKVSNLVPTLHIVYILSTDSPKELLKSEFGLKDLEVSYLSDIEAVNKVQAMARELNLNKFYDYATIYDRFVLVHGSTGVKFKFTGINSLPNLLESKGIDYVKVMTVVGDGFTVLGTACGIKSSIQPSTVYEELTMGDWEI